MTPLPCLKKKPLIETTLGANVLIKKTELRLLRLKYVLLYHLGTIPNLNLRILEDTKPTVTHRALK